MQAYLIEHAASLGVMLTAQQAEQLLAYLKLIQKWNRVHNLTAVRDPEKMLPLHILDSLSVSPYITVSTLLDVGSGAGLPGIPLAIINPSLHVTLNDSNKKKATFQQQVVIELALTNVTVQTGRVEEINPEHKFDGIISRAFSEISLFIEFTRHLMGNGAYWYAMKGINPEQELTALPDGIIATSIHELNVPLLDAQRHLIILKEVDG